MAHGPTRGRVAIVAAAVLLSSCNFNAGGGVETERDASEIAAERAEVEAWRAQHEQSYRDEYVVLGGLFFLKPGANTAGSAASNDVVLPSRAPASIGTFVLTDGTVTFQPAPGAAVTLDGKALADAVDLHDDFTDHADELGVGDLTMWIHESGDRRAVRLKDPQSDVAKSFAGFTWYPVDPAYRVVGRFIKDEQPTQLRVANLSGDWDDYTTEGQVEFTLNGQTRRLRPMTTEPNQFFFVFRDGTSGKETYEAARFLYSELAPDGTTVLDFNEAYNPPCSFNPYTTCPIPPPENRLDIAIRAGEKKYVGSPEF
jgi:uncharacterized protein (DUF1684 family)